MRRWPTRTVLGCFLLTAFAATVWAGHRRKDDEPKPQVLPLPRELPRAVSASTDSLTFKVTPLLTTGHLSSQIHDTLNELIRGTKGATIIKLRAFVAGAGDSRRVQQMVSDMFTDKKLPLPALTIVQVGALGKEAAAVVIEAIVSGRQPVNPDGLAFIARQSGATLPDALAKMNEAISGAHLTAANVVSATCFTDRLAGYDAERQTLASAFPGAAINLVQALRDPIDTKTTCQAVAQLPPGATLPPSNRDNVAFVTSPQIVFTGLQLSFGAYLDDADSALSRMQRDVQTVHADVRNTVLMNAFSLDPAAASAIEERMPKFNFPQNTLTVQPVQGLPSLDASLGLEAVLAPGENSRTGTNDNGIKVSARR
jgi:enamine deaminase RidA (YjgF/YER057c/UK114 family)